MPLNERLMEILCCPACKESLEEKEDRLVCRGCRRAYPIRDGIPVMLIDEATIEGKPQEAE
ncbi:MAG: Trm112 family protein [Armatimonadetes bacterium]|nr:Trm112 family protein [Armatimonadota bacterium]